MKTFCTALLFVAVSAAAAEPVDSQSGTGTDAAPNAAISGKGSGSAWSQRSDVPAPQNDDASDDSGASSSSGLNYETGQLCVTRGAGGICLESSDD
jgi:hypothetical protein